MRIIPRNASLLALTFLVAAMKDALSGNLDRIQIIKGWMDAKGDRHEQVYDVAWSGDRKPGADGKLPAVGNTVDVANATWTNTIGAPELIAVWEDPEFDPDVPAVYYARVLEIPTPRWTAYEAEFYGITMPPEEIAYAAHADRQFLLSELQRDEVRQQIIELGVDPAEIESRMDALQGTEPEVRTVFPGQAPRRGSERWLKFSSYVAASALIAPWLWGAAGAARGP